MNTDNHFKIRLRKRTNAFCGGIECVWELVRCRKERAPRSGRRCPGKWPGSRAEGWRPRPSTPLLAQARPRATAGLGTGTVWRWGYLWLL